MITNKGNYIKIKKYIQGLIIIKRYYLIKNKKKIILISFNGRGEKGGARYIQAS
jgi:hypothetical protein